MIIVSEQDYNDLQELYKTAKNTPVITLSVQDAIEGKDFATQAWNRVREKMDQLGEKYGYDPKTHAINSKREVIGYQQ